MAAIVLMAAVVLPLLQGAIIRLNASETKLDASSTSYRYRLFFILRVYPPFNFTLGGFVLCYLHYTIKFVVNQISISGVRIPVKL